MMNSLNANYGNDNISIGRFAGAAVGNFAGAINSAGDLGTAS